MQIKFNEIKNFKIENINFYLLYGVNSGLVEETIDKVFKPKLSKNIINFEENEIFNKIELFDEIVFNKSFFDEDKLIIIKRASEKILNLIKEIVEKKLDNIKIIITCGKLEKKSKLRSFFEKSQQTVIIPFYEDNYQSLLLLVQNFLKEKKIKISVENINLIIERSKGNRINLKNELEKISSYSKNGKPIKFKDIVKLTNLAEDYNATELVDYCLAKNKRKTLHIFNENNLNTGENILILKSFLQKLKRLKKIREHLSKNKNIDEVLSIIKPPIFWKDKEIIKQQLINWDLKEINSLIKITNYIEMIVKKNSNTSNLITNNFILENLIKANNSI